MIPFDQWCEISPIGDLLVRGAGLTPDRPALVLPEEQRSYAELLGGACMVARGLMMLGVGSGDHVGLLAPNSVEFAEALFGISLLGAVVVPLHARHRAAELGYIIENADLVAVLTTSAVDAHVDFAEVLHEALPSLAQAGDPADLELPEAPRLRSMAVLRGGHKPGFLDRDRFEQLASLATRESIDQARRRVRARDVGVILYTSGTTAHPKGCLLTHEAMMRGALERARGRLAKTDRLVTWGAGPLFHIASLAPFLGSIGSAGTFLTDVYFEPGRALELMARERVTTVFPWFPAIMQALLDHPSFDADELRSMHSMLLIGPPALHQRVQSELPWVEVMQACGMTETAGIYAISDPSDTPSQRAETQGRRCPGIEVRIIDPETGAELPPGTAGEILVRGYCVMEGYYREPEKTAEALDEGRWLHTGDLYRQTEGGHLVFNGRLKDMLKVGGENVAALELESFLCEHPAVKLAEVVAMPDLRLEEVPVAFVELRPGCTLEAEELIDFCRGRIASYKVPRAVHFLTADEWPMSATKVDKRELRRRVSQESGAATPN
jgi:fatty-acyl-CoA synthase/long-chain acyl-CoA synthetase